MLKFVSWNVNGLRARVSRGGFLEFCHEFSPDFICVQETKMFPWQKEFALGEYYEYWNPSLGKGSGTAVFANRKAISMVSDMGIDLNGKDGRVITLEYRDFTLVTAYVPSASGGKRRESLRNKLAWLEIFESYIQKLNSKKPVVVCGDMNIAHDIIDLYHPDKNSIGFTDGERAVIDRILKSGFVDSYRYLHPDTADQFTWVSNKNKTGGLRLDYFFVSEQLKSAITQAEILREKAKTDHCPIILGLDL